MKRSLGAVSLCILTAGLTWGAGETASGGAQLAFAQLGPLMTSQNGAPVMMPTMLSTVSDVVPQVRTMDLSMPASSKVKEVPSPVRQPSLSIDLPPPQYEPFEEGYAAHSRLVEAMALESPNARRVVQGGPRPTQEVSAVPSETCRSTDLSVEPSIWERQGAMPSFSVPSPAELEDAFDLVHEVVAEEGAHATNPVDFRLYWMQETLSDWRAADLMALHALARQHTPLLSSSEAARWNMMRVYAQRALERRCVGDDTPPDCHREEVQAFLEEHGQR